MSKVAEVGSTANSYEILAKLAVGGMAEIFLARGASVAGVSRYVVLKRILRHRASDVQFVRMFLDEARLAAQLQHPNIAQVHDIGRLGDSYFFTMEYVHGETVRALLHRAHATRKPIPIGCVMTIVAGAAQGLHHAHDRNGMDGRPLGIVHRDVSPSNLMVSYEGNVKLVDFGVAKAADRVSETRSGTVKGKISYLSPEQCRGAAVDRRSDLFALGIVLWEMLVTERLFRRASDFENMTAIVQDVVPRPSTRRADVPPELDALVMKMLAKRPDERYQTGDEVVEALEAVAARCGFVLSTSALGRYVREVFGQKPEPWIEMDGHAPPDGVTVTSQPIPAELAAPTVGSVDNALLNVADLSAHLVTSDSFDVDAAPESRSGTRGADSRDAMATVKLAAVDAPPLVVPAPAPSASGSLSGPRVLPARARVPIAVWILAPAIVIGVVIGAVMSLRERVPAPAIAPADARPAPVADAAAPVVVAVVTPPDAGAPADAEPDAAPADAAVPVDARAVAPTPHAPPPVSDPADLVATCSSAPGRLTGESARQCALAACRVHREADARRWLAGTAPSRRAGIIAACAAAGTPLEHAPPPPHPRDAGVSAECAADPLACQH